MPRPRQPAPAPLDAAPDLPTIDELRKRARGCKACPLWKPATQTVFGEGPERARVMMIGEQPGDQEDRAGHPFVGPAGRMLDKALADAGVERGTIYLTNTVKHFKFEPRGKLRLHKRPNAAEQRACRPWLQAELERIRPRYIVCLGAMAAAAIFGPAFRLTQERGRWRTLESGAQAFATVHPSFLLRVPSEDREQAYRDFVRDLRLLARRAS